MARPDSKKRKIIWAIDPLEASQERPGKLQANAATTLRRLSEQYSCDIEPVYVLNAAPDFSPEYDFQWTPMHRELAQTAAIKIFKKVALNRLLPLKILPQAGTSTYGAADILASYASKSHALLLVANTHSKTGIKRFFLGSFAETLMLRSRTPVITVGPHTPKVQPFERILFPTDFAPHTHLVFKKVLDLAKTLQSKITLLYVIPFTIQPYSSGNILFPGAYWGAYMDFVASSKRFALKHAESWLKMAEKKGIPMETLIDERGSRSIWESILSHARKKKASMIAMESVSGPLSSAMIGSITRQVVRHAQCPVWTLHPRALQKPEVRRAPPSSLQVRKTAA